MKSSAIFVVLFIAVSLNSFSAAVDSVDCDDQQSVGGKSIIENKEARMVEKAFGIIKEKLQNKKYEDVEIALNEKKTMTNLIADEISILINETKSMKLIYKILKKFPKQIKYLSANFEIKKRLEKLMRELANKINKNDLNKSVLIFLQEKIQAEVKADPNLKKMVNSQIITMFIQQIPIIYEEELRNLEMLKKNKKLEIESKVFGKFKHKSHLRSASLGEENFPRKFGAKISGQNKLKLGRQKDVPDMINLMDMEWPNPSMEGNLMKQQSAPDLHYEDSPHSQYEANMNKLKDLVISKSETNISEHNEDGNKSPKKETHFGGGNSPHKNGEQIFHMDMVPKLTKIKTKIVPENEQKSPRKYAEKIGSPTQSEWNRESPQSGKNHHLENEHEFRGKHYLEKETFHGMVKTPSESLMASFWSNQSSPRGMMEDNSEWQFKNRNNDQHNLVRTNTAVFTALEQENMMAELAEAMQDLEQTSNIDEEENVKERKINGNGSEESTGVNIQIDPKIADSTKTNMAVTKRKKWDKVQSHPPALLSNPNNWATNNRSVNLPKNVKSPNPLPVPAFFNVQQNNSQIGQLNVKNAKLGEKSDGHSENSHYHLDDDQQSQSPLNFSPKNNSDQDGKNPFSPRQEKQMGNESPNSRHNNVHPNLANQKEAEEGGVDQNAEMDNQIGSSLSRKMMGNEEEVNDELANKGNEMSPKSPKANLDGNEEIRSNIIEKSDSIKSDSLHQNPADESTNSNEGKTIGQIQNGGTITIEGQN